MGARPLYRRSPSKPRIGLNVFLFLLTLLTTTFAGALQEGVNPLETRAIYTAASLFLSP